MSKNISRQTHPDAFIKMNLFFIVLVCVKRIRTNVVENQLFPDLQEEKIKNKKPTQLVFKWHTLNLNLSRSSKVKLSLFAMTGTTLTTSLSFFITITSIGLNAWPVGLIKYKQQWIRVSWMYRSRMAVSSLRRYALCWSLIYLIMGSQLLTRLPNWGYLWLKNTRKIGRTIPRCWLGRRNQECRLCWV